MGIYINPGNSGFQRITNSEYVDKTGLIRLVSETIETVNNLICVSRPRRFGKSFAAQMLCAYYDCSCDSRGLFRDKEIAKTEGYLAHLNRYHVINLDITGFISEAKRLRTPLADVPNRIAEAVLRELGELVSCGIADKSLTDALIACAEETGRKFIFIIDEWDALIREARQDRKTQENWLNLLREWFKNSSFTPRAVAAAYMTGILPIRKDGSQSAISDFHEYSMLDPGIFAAYTGFTEAEVKRLCEKHRMSFDDARAWYDGYDFPETGAVYNPYSIMSAMRTGKYRSYWRKTSASESLMSYVNMDFEGLQEIIVRLLAGEAIEVCTDSYENDFETFRSKDDVLTLLMHLGYLTYCEKEETARIPNEEVRMEFEKILAGSGTGKRFAELFRRSGKLLEDTIAGKAASVADVIQEIRDTEYAPTFYNNEQALRYVVKFAYIAALESYLKIEELPSGRGIADVVYLPKRMSGRPAVVVELKWNRSAGGAVEQIRKKRYPAVLEDYSGEIVLVGINYDEKTKKHTCVIEKIFRKVTSRRY